MVWGGKPFISTQFSVAEPEFCLSFKFWLNFRFFKNSWFLLNYLFSLNFVKILQLVHKLAWMVACYNPKFQNFAQSILASTTFLPKHTSSSESHDTSYTCKGSFSHWELVKAMSSVLTWEGHRKQGMKHWYFHTFIRIFCNKISAKTSYRKPHHAVKATTHHILARGPSLIESWWKPWAAF